MNEYNWRLFFRISLPVLFSGIMGYFLAVPLYWASAIAGVFAIVSMSWMLSFLQRSVKDMMRLLNGIRFSELNISFRNFSKKGLNPQLAPQMEAAIAAFNKRLHALEGLQTFYETLLGRIDFAIIVIDKTGKIEWINKAALDIFGKPQPRKMRDLSHVSEALMEDLNLLIPRETRIIRFEKEKRKWQMAATALLFTLDGKSLKLISLKNIESVLEESESDAWKKLIRILTHEIMNSLSPIISLSDTFSKPDPETLDFMPQAMQTIHRRSKGLIDFVNNYQKLAKIPTPVKSVFLVSDLLEDIRNLLKADHLTFSYSLENKDISLNADRGQIEQVMINLIKNACESSDSDIPAEVKVVVSKDNYQRTQIQVMDNGQGILPEILDKIFVPFFTTKANGSGIGLSISKQIINLHGGSLSVESESEKGSVISVVI